MPRTPGFTPDLVATAWVGFDQERSLGDDEEGGKTALPIWVYFMREALKSRPERHRPLPLGLITLRISPDTGMLASAENPDAVLETFMIDRLPSGDMLGDEGEESDGLEERVSGESIF